MSSVKNQQTFPRPGSSIYNFTQNDEVKQRKTLKKWKRLNKYFTLPFYRIGLLPSLGFGRIFLLLKTKGRVTGKTRRTPVEYHWIHDIIHVFSGRGEQADWIKNMRANPDQIWVRHGFHWFHATPEFVERHSEKDEILKWYVENHPRAAKMLFGWNPKQDDSETADLSPLINLITVVRLHK